MDDTNLLRRFAESGSQDAFAEVVRRHLDLVYSVALRRVGGDAHLAQDVSQQVFIALARRAAALARHPVLTGWLYTTTHFTAAKAVRAAQRRQAREQAAQAMNDQTSSPGAEADWARLHPALDDAMLALGDRDREAVLLRFFAGRAFADIGAQLGLSENAARMRVDRALDKLRARLARRGVVSTATALALLLTEHAVAAAPAGLASTISGAAVAGAAAGGGSLAFWSFMSASKLLTGVTAAAVIAAGVVVIQQQQAIGRLQTEAASLQAQNQALPALRAENQRLKQQQVPADELARLQADHAELVRLREEVTALRKQVEPAPPPSTASRAVENDARIYDLRELDIVPKVRHQTPPIYPLPLMFGGSAGEVVIGFTVDATGDVVDAQILKSSDPAFDDSALAAVREWKFDAGRKGGVPVNTRMSVPIMYTVSDEARPPGKH